MHFIYLVALALLPTFIRAETGVQHKVKCDGKEMKVEMMLTSDVNDVYLEGMKEYGKELGCQPTIDENTATFRLSLTDFTRCAVTKIVDQSSGRKDFYHRVVVERDSGKESILVKCGWSKSNRLQRRDVLADDFVEETEFDITVVEGRAPQPILGIVVKQNGQNIDTELNVLPGTLLQMDIFLDANSTSTYGLRVSYMDVTDRKTKEETIILNGCSVDPYLFENFNTVDGDSLSARFRAFKFPDTNFVLFRGTIDVCLDRCSGVECSNDQIAFGRKKRETKALPNDKVFTVSMSTVVKFDDTPAVQKDTLESLASTRTERQEPVAKLGTAQEVAEEPVTTSEPQPEPEPEPAPAPEPHSSAVLIAFNMALLFACLSLTLFSF